MKNYVEYKNENDISVVEEKLYNNFLFEVENIPFSTPKNYTFKFIDLFAGIGGFRIAMQNVGGKCVYTSEWNKDAQKTYRENFGSSIWRYYKDSIKNYVQKNLMFCAGFPCQAFSIAGLRKGFSDTRGTLFLI